MRSNEYNYKGKQLWAGHENHRLEEQEDLEDESNGWTT